MLAPRATSRKFLLGVVALCVAACIFVMMQQSVIVHGEIAPLVGAELLERLARNRALSETTSLRGANAATAAQKAHQAALIAEQGRQQAQPRRPAKHNAVPNRLKSLVSRPAQDEQMQVKARKQAGLLFPGAQESDLVASSWDMDLNELHLVDLLLSSSSEAELAAGFAAESYTKYSSHIMPIAGKTAKVYREDGRLDARGVFAAHNKRCAKGTGEAHGLCSVGHVRGFIGSIDDLDNLRAMLDARKHSNELILLMCDAAHLDMPLNAILSLMEYGYAHYVLLMLSEEECLQAADIIPEIGCVWSNFMLENPPEKYWHNVRRLWMVRWLLVLRLIQHETNVLMMDSDNGVLHDPYHYLKHPLLEQYHLITPFEPNLPGINCGAIYIQNASVDGPVAWMAGEVAERTLRWMEHITWLEDRLPAIGFDPTWMDAKALFEQDIYNDAACSAIAGRPLYHNTFSPHKIRQPTAYGKWHGLHDQLCGQWTDEVVTFPDDWAAVAFGNTTGIFQRHVLRLPQSRGQWPKHLGGYPYPPHRGRLSLLAQAWIRKGAPDGAIWPMPEDLEDPRGLRSARVEHLLRTPPWLFSRWPETGFVGWWDPQLTEQASGVLAHTIVMQGNEGEGKFAPFKAYGWWRWEVNEMLAGPLLFRASTPAAPLPRVLALAPEVSMMTESEEHLFALAHHLARAAVLANRTLAWPRTHCNSPWLRRPKEWQPPDSDPLPIREHRFVSYGGLDDLTCVSFLFMSVGCHTVGMPLYDFAHLLDLLPPSARERREENTILFEKLGSKVPPVFPHYEKRWKIPEEELDKVPPEEVVYSVDGPQLELVLQAMDHEPVVWVGGALQVHDFPEARRPEFTEFLRTCDKQLLRSNTLVTDGWWQEELGMLEPQGEEGTG